jgi:hypothetical protein
MNEEAASEHFNAEIEKEIQNSEEQDSIENQRNRADRCNTSKQ